MRFRLKTLTLPAAALALLFLDSPRAGGATACNAAQCLTNDAVIQRADPSNQANDASGDYSFFSTPKGSMPNVMFVLDNSTSMYELPYNINFFPNSGWVCPAQTGTRTAFTTNRAASASNCAFVSMDVTKQSGATKAGATPAAANTSRFDSAANLALCHNNAYFESVLYQTDPTQGGYNNSKTYKPYDPSFPGYFTSTNYYKWMDWDTSSPGGSAGNTITVTSGSGKGKTFDAGGVPTTACSAMSGTLGSGGKWLDTNNGNNNYYELTMQQRCQMCLDEAGYFIGPNATDNDSRLTAPTGNIVFKGNWLNFFPPKFIVARKALTDVIAKQVPSATNLVPTPMRIGVSTYDNQNVNDLNVALGSKMRADDGGALISGMVPSCSSSSWAQADATALINSVNAISFGSNDAGAIATPMAETLFNVGQYLSGSDTYYNNTFGAGWTKGAFTAPAAGSATAPYCGQCQSNSIVLITDGNPDGDNQLPACTTSTNTTGALNCAINTHKATCASPGCGVDEGNGTTNLLADVTNFLASNDVSNKAGSQNITTYVIGLSLSSSLLDAAAKYGGSGAAKEADDAASLAASLNVFTSTVVNRSTSFSSTAIQTLQIGTGSVAFVPRFVPANPTTVPTPSVWEGHLFRFELVDEFTLGKDVNGDGSLSSVFLEDKDSDLVSEDDSGNFIKSSGNSAGQLAQPFWDAGKVMQNVQPDGSSGGQLGSRKLYTAIYDTGSATWNTVPWPTDTTTDPTTFAAIEAALNISSTTACANIQSLMAQPIPKRYLDASSNLTGDGCALAIMDWVRGWNVLADRPEITDPDPRNSHRSQVLGDIFHSSPILVEPPVDQFLCQLGLKAQCVSTLFQDANPPANGVIPTPTDTYGTNKVDAYEKFWEDHETRQEIVVTGANDFMIHGFDAGTAQTPLTLNTIGGQRTVQYDQGTGAEVWGFIPPDQLARIWLAMRDGRQLSMDGDIMVRDVWADGTANDTGGAKTPDLKKQSWEFHTIAIAGEREGGTHFIALDVTDTTTPKMLWMYPPPCDPEELEWGNTWGQFAPRPAPIGPVLLQNPAGQSNYGVKTEERWVAFLNGGHSAFDDRGRATAMVDVWTGKPLFVANYNPSASDPSGAMRFGFPATITMADYGEANKFEQDGFFDTAVAGDEGGQLWTFRFAAPGAVDASTGLVTNWTFGRAYEPNSTTPLTALDHEAIYSPASLAVDVGNFNWLHAYVGTGDRAHVRSMSGGDCRPDDPMTCLQAGCAVSSEEVMDNGPNHFDSTFAAAASTTAAKPVMVAPTQTLSTTANACNVASVTQTFKATGSSTACLGATQTLSWKENFPATAPATGTVTTDALYATVSSNNRGISAPPPNNGFVGVVVLSGTADAAPIGTAKARAMQLPADQSSYDSGRLSSTTTGQLVDVSSVTSFTTGSTASTSATPTSAGWRLTYARSPDEKTVTGATVLGGCVIWNTLVATGAAASCASVGTNTAAFYQADAITGLPNCASSFLSGNVYARLITRNVLSPPPEPAAAVAIGANGSGERFSTLEIQPAAPGSGSSKTPEVTQMTVSTSNDSLQLIYSLPLTADQHTCRHVDASKCK
jgi:type IV pilus assembly protein PilY1